MNPPIREELMHEFYVVPYQEPNGLKTWAVREIVYGPNRYLRQLISFHPTREDAETARVVAYRKVGVDVGT